MISRKAVNWGYSPEGFLLAIKTQFIESDPRAVSVLTFSEPQGKNASPTGAGFEHAGTSYHAALLNEAGGHGPGLRSAL